MNKQKILDLYFMDARAKLLDLAAFLDRMDRASGDADFRLQSLKECLPLLQSPSGTRARDVLELLSDPTTEPARTAGERGASGAWPGSPRGDAPA